MEMKEAERSVVAKPVATRPTCSKFRSFSELLAGAINSSPTTTSVETSVAAIRPKTVRFKPAVLRAPNTGNSSQVEITGTATNDSTDKISKSSEKPTVIYKPLAKLVSKSTVSLLANMGSFKSGQHQTQPAAPAKSFTQEQYKTRSQLSISRNQSTASQAETDVVSEPLKLASQNMEEEARTSAAANTDRPSYDGYNWRKYGQKQVKGSECPRSYYKCTHPNCPVKKKVERSLDGQITEIVYKGEHNHQKPQPLKRSSSGLANVPESSGPDTNFMLNGSHPTEANDVSEGRIENQHTTYRGKGAVACDPIASATANFNGTVPDNSCGVSGEYTDGSRGVEMEDDEPSSKRRRSENQSNEAGISGEGTQDACVVVQNSADTEILGDGFRWRKYGQKVVKGNPYPRSYYRCTGLKCNVRKHVERASDDPRSFITTYEGKHNHDMPRRSANPAGSESDVQGTTIKD